MHPVRLVLIDKLLNGKTMLLPLRLDDEHQKLLTE